MSVATNTKQTIFDTLVTVLGLMIGGAGLMMLGTVTTGVVSPWLILLVVLAGPPLIATPLLAPLLLLVSRQLAGVQNPRRVVLNLASSIFFGSLLVGLVLLVFLFVFSFDTEYAPGYAESRFRAIEVGHSEAQVIATLGEPLTTRELKPVTVWIYTDQPIVGAENRSLTAGSYTAFHFSQNGQVTNVYGQLTDGEMVLIGEGKNFLGLTSADIEALFGASPTEVRARFGPPATSQTDPVSKLLVYSRSPSSANYHLRQVGLDASGRVVRLWREIYWD